MLQQLMKNDELLRSQLLKIEESKLALELQEIDFTSKESMSKLTTQLMLKNEQYKTWCSHIEQLKVEIDVNHRRLSVVRELMNNKMLTSFEQVDRFLSQLYDK